MASNIGDILKELGWADGFRIPVANEENKRLEEEIEKKTKYKASLYEKLRCTEERLKMVKEHTIDLKFQRDLNQKLLVAHTAQLNTEDHLYRLSASTESNLRQEARNFEKEWKDVNNRVSNIEKDLINIMKKLETSKKAVKFDETNLLKWEEILNRKEEDNYLIEKYMKEDSKKYRELEQKRQKLSMELESYRQAIIKAVNETGEMEIILDRTTKLYDNALKEHRDMINQWTQSVTVLRQRDNNIQTTLKEIETLREIEKDKRNNFQEAERFLRDQITNNKQLEDSTKQLEKQLVTIRNEYGKITDTIGMYEIELRTQKKNIENLARRSQQVRADIKRKKIEINNKNVKTENWQKRINELKITSNQIVNQKLNIEDKSKQLREMIEEEEKRKSTISKDVNRLQAAILRTANQITHLDNEKKVLEIQNQNEKKKSELLLINFSKEKKLLEEKKESLYQVEFNVQKCEMKLERIKGHERDKSGLEKKQKALEELNNVLSEKLKISKLLKTQITNLEHDMKKMSNSLANDNKQLEHLRNKKQDLVLLMDGGEKCLKAAQCHNEERQVEENILRLKVTQLEQMTMNIGDKVYNLQVYRLELDAALRERETEIVSQKESLVVQKRVATSECAELHNAISERKGRVKQLQIRYDTSIAAFGCNPDGTPVTTTYLKIQSAQERYLLQEQGDKLDKTIRKTEQEIESMENTLRIVNACNNKYKANLSIVHQNAPEQAEQKKLDQEMDDFRKKLKERQSHFHLFTEDLQKMQGNYSQLLNDMERIKEEKENKQQHLSNLERQITEQQEKILRADKSLRKVHRDIQQMCLCTEDNVILLQEKDVRLREIQEQNALALEDIAEFTIRHVEVEAYIKKLLAAKNVKLPFMPQTVELLPLSQGESASNSVECLAKSTNRGSTFISPKESIGSIINLEPDFIGTKCSHRPSSKHITTRK